MSDQRNDEEQRRDQLLLRLLKTPPQPRPQRDRGKEVSQAQSKESSRPRGRPRKQATPSA